MSAGAGSWMRSLAFAALLAAGCTSGNGTGAGVTTPGNSPLASFSPTAVTSPTPSGVCGPTTRCLALVTLRGSDQLVVRDITDIAHPTTITTFTPPGGSRGAQFVSATEISFMESTPDPNHDYISRSPLSGMGRTVVVDSPKNILAFAWSPDGKTVVYMTGTDSGTDIHLLKEGTDRVIGYGPSQGGGGCESIAGCAIANSLDTRLTYSPDGTVISLVSSGFGPSALRIWSADGSLLKSSDSAGLTMSIWSGKSLYFRDIKGVEVWRHAGESLFLPGVAWIRPQASPAGGLVAYTARDSAGWGHTYTVDTATKKVHEIKSNRSTAVFLTARYLWHQGERACVATDGCGPTPPFHPLSGTTYIFDLQDGTESGSIITSVTDVWPHAA
jgi:hypothetical protein